MATPVRRTLPLPYGQRAYVLSDLDLRPDHHPSRAVLAFSELLRDLDEPVAVIIAGNLVADLARVEDRATYVTEALRSAPNFTTALRHVLALGGSVTILPGARDAALGHDDVGTIVEEWGFTLASDVMLLVATAQGVRELAVVAGSHEAALGDLDDDLRDAVRLLEDPSAGTRFLQSRVLYGRLGPSFWLPIVLLVTIVVAAMATWLVNHLGHRHLAPLGHHRWRVVGGPNGTLDSIALILLGLAGFEAVLALLAGAYTRRRFNSLTGAPARDVDTLGLLEVGNENALDVARRVAARGGAGAVVGGGGRPALLFMDRGVCATPGVSREVLVERRGRFGLPPVFAVNERVAYVEIEAAANVTIRLVAGSFEPPARALRARLNGLIAGAALLSAPGETLSQLGTWPSGDPWPLDPNTLTTQRRLRRTRRLVAGLVGLVGAANVAVALVRPLRAHLHAALTILPIGVVQSAAAGTALAGIGLLMMARGLLRGQRRPWLVASMLLTVTVATHLVRGGSLAGSFVALVTLGTLLSRRAAFTGATDATTPRTIWRVVLAVPLLAVLANSLGVKLASGHAATPSWARTFVGSVERLVGVTSIHLTDRADDIGSPVLLAVGLASIILALYLFTRPVVDRRLSEHASSAERRLAELRARDIVRRHGRGTLDYFALRDDKQFFFHRDSLVAYAVYGGVALVSPDPIGPPAEQAEVFAAFRAYADAHGWTIGVVGAGSGFLDTYRDAGYHTIYVGDEAVVNCQTFSLEGGKMKGLRQACSRLAKKGYTIEFHDPAEMDPAAIKGILDLIGKLRRGEGERGFSMMLGRLFNPKDKGLLLTLVRDPNGVPAAACQFVPSPAINGYSLDLMRRDPDEHPNGLIDYALCATIEELRRRGGQGLSLNFSAFRSILDGEKGDGTLLRVERWALRRLSGILPIESLWSFNAKYLPGWLPRYLVYPAVESFVPVVAAVLRAESLTEIPVIGRLLASDPSNRPGTVVPDEILAAAEAADIN